MPTAATTGAVATATGNKKKPTAAATTPHTPATATMQKISNATERDFLSIFLHFEIFFSSVKYFRASVSEIDSMAPYANFLILL
jgi:hypothetical protein